MKQLFTIVISAIALAGCSGAGISIGGGTGNQFIVLGEATIPGSQAVGEANVAVRNANAAGCNAISVGGYGLGSEATLIGVPVLIECPAGIRLLPNGTRDLTPPSPWVFDQVCSGCGKVRTRWV
jgi:hypothetical protein